MRTPLIAGNWKMHKTLAEGRELVRGIQDGLARVGKGRGGPGGASASPRTREQTIDGAEILICPPFQLLFPLAVEIKGSPILLGAQNAHEEPQGAFTGEVSVPMLKDAGCAYVIIGHSERRQLFREEGPRLAKKTRAVLDGGLRAIYCVGETLAQRETGRTEDVIKAQLSEVVDRDLDSDRLVIAYEPVWAIGTGRTATPQQAQEVHACIRRQLAVAFDEKTAAGVRILYGGSVKAANAAGLLAEPDIDGALVGGACLVAQEFLAIISAAIGASA